MSVLRIVSTNIHGLVYINRQYLQLGVKYRKRFKYVRF